MSGGAAAACRLLAAANAVLAIPVAYIGSMTLISSVLGTQRQLGRGGGDPTTRFVVLVPAHNEEMTISMMLSSMRGQDYPPSLFAVHVVADNCVDSTARTAAAFGVEVHERFDAVERGKGPALNWLMTRLLKRSEPFDVAVFIDADTTVAKEFLSVLDRRFRHGAVAVQGYYGVREAFESTPATLRYCALAARHHARPLARTAIGGSCGLFGNGMAFTRDVVMHRTWTSHLVEDMEFQLELLLGGVLVEYEPLARVEAEMPHTFDDSVTQHQRWEVGRLDLVRRYVPKLIGHIVHPRNVSRLAAADATADMCVPPLSILASATAMSAGVGVLLAAVTPHRSRANAVVAMAMLTTVCVHVVAALRLVRAPKQAYKSLLHAPKLAIWKLLLLIRSVRGTNGDWIRTRRNAESAEP